MLRISVIKNPHLPTVRYEYTAEGYRGSVRCLLLAQYGPQAQKNPARKPGALFLIARFPTATRRGNDTRCRLPWREQLWAAGAYRLMRTPKRNWLLPKSKSVATEPVDTDVVTSTLSVPKYRYSAKRLVRSLRSYPIPAMT